MFISAFCVVLPTPTYSNGYVNLLQISNKPTIFRIKNGRFHYRYQLYVFSIFNHRQLLCKDGNFHMLRSPHNHHRL